jgi:hypothetical protein
MITDLNSFLHSLARSTVAYAAAQTPAVALVYRPVDGTIRNLWRNKAVEDRPDAATKRCGDPYTVLRAYGGKADAMNPKASISLQMKTVGTSDDAAMSFARVVYEAIALDDYGNAVRMLSIGAYDAVSDAMTGHWMIVNIDTLQVPAQTGRDERDRVEIVSNIDIGFLKTA